jgi:hypothetical protein
LGVSLKNHGGQATRWCTALCLAGISACGWFGGAPADAPPAEVVPERKSAFLPPDDLGAGEQTQRVLTQEVRERMGFVGAAADLRLEWPVDGVVSTHRVSFEQISMRVADVPTLLYPIGHLKVDPMTWTTEPDATLAKALTRHFFRDDSGAPVQVFFDIQTIGKLDGRLDRDGASATGQVIGAIQVDSRQHIAVFQGRFTRPTKDKLVMETVEPIEVPLSEFHRDTQLAAAMAAFGAKAWEPVVKLSGRVELTEANIDALPSFIRVAVTEQTISELQQRLDEEIDDFDAFQYRMEQQGVREEIRNNVTPEQFEKMREMARKRAGNPDGRM